ncbi:MAG TPA: glycosyltransferase family 4 protein [Terracidiphilus sp.]|nr:glycosyltransferase family 4 protein [Terracidiphilus sp.]
MNLGFASPISLQFLRPLVENGEAMPPGYQFAPTADWVRELLRRGHRVTVYTTAREIAAPQTFRGEGLTIRIAPQRKNGTGRDFFAAERAHLRQMMVEDRCEVIHAHWTYQFALAALEARLPTLVTIHDLPWKVLAYFRDMHRAARLAMAYMVAARGRHFTAVSKDAADHFQRYFNPAAEITVVPNGLPEALFEHAGAGRRGGDDVVFATVLQGWSRRKNATAALYAFQQVVRAVPRARLLMFGVDYERDGAAHRWAAENALEKNVEFVGAVPYRELLARLSSEVDIVVHPSLDESFSMAAVEAMALRKPVIAGAQTPGVREVLGFGENGVLTDVRRPEAIAEAMLLLARDEQARQRIGQSGFDRARACYRLETVMQQYEDQYHGVLRQ